MDKFQDFIHHKLEKLLSPEDKVVLIYSGLWSFAPRAIQDFKIPLREFPNRLIKAIEFSLGPDRTLIFPTYTFRSFPKTKHYDKLLSKSDVGILSQETIGNHSFLRTNQCIYSHSVKGPFAETLMSSPSTTACGKDSVMGWFYENDISIFTLGVPWERSCSFIHSAEELARVPYRFFKRFSGKMTENNQNPSSCHEVMYVRSKLVPAIVDYSPATRLFRKENLIYSSDDECFPLQKMKAKALFDSTIRLLESDPYAFVKNYDDVKKWELTNKNSELESLLQEQSHDS